MRNDHQFGGVVEAMLFMGDVHRTTGEVGSNECLFSSLLPIVEQYDGPSCSGCSTLKSELKRRLDRTEH